MKPLELVHLRELSRGKASNNQAGRVHDMTLTTVNFAISQTESVLIGRAFMRRQNGHLMAVGEIFKNSHILELSLFLMPTDGRIDLMFDHAVEPGQRDLNAVVFGRHDTYQYTVGTVSVRRREGTAQIEAVPCYGASRCHLFF